MCLTQFLGITRGPPSELSPLPMMPQDARSRSCSSPGAGHMVKTVTGTVELYAESVRRTSLPQASASPLSEEESKAFCVSGVMIISALCENARAQSRCSIMNELARCRTGHDRDLNNKCFWCREVCPSETQTSANSKKFCQGMRKQPTCP